MTSLRIVISVNDPPAWVIPEREVERIASVLKGDVVTNAPTAAERRQTFPDADVLLTTIISADEFGLARRLKWIHSSAVGVARLLPAAVVTSDVVVSNSRGVHSEAIAEHALALILALRRRLHVAAARQRDRAWAQLELAAVRERPLAETTLLIVGMGTIGARLAAMAAALGMRVIGVRKRLDQPVPSGVADVLPVERLQEGLRDADAVVLAIPRTHDNRVLIGASELAVMKSSAAIVNVARGQLVDEPALIAALSSGRLAAAGLDAFQREPLPPDHPFWSMPNVLMTPHTAAFAKDYWSPVVDVFLDNVERYRAGRPLRNVVDKTLGY